METAITAECVLPAEIRVESLLPTGTRYILPPRGMHKLGAIAIAAGLVDLVMTIAFAISFVGGFQGAFGDWGLASMAFFAPFVISGLGLLAIGAALSFGHCELEIDGEDLCWIERVGPIRRRRRRPLAEIRRLSVEQAGESSEAKSQATSQLGSSAAKSAPTWMSAIKIETAGKPWWIAWANERALLVPLAQQIAKECNALASDSNSGAVVDVVEVVDAAAGPPRRTAQPTGSLVVCEQFADGVTFDVPPAGLFKGGGGILVFGLVWSGFTAIFFTLMLVANGGLGNDQFWMVLAMMTLFSGAGIAMVVGGVNMGRRRAAVAVVGDSVMALQTGLFGSRSGEWQRTEIKEIRVGPSGMSVNDKPVLQLQIVPVTGKTFGLLTGRDVAEIEWMATLLNDAVGSQVAQANDDR